jgi:hypothetical protein
MVKKHSYHYRRSGCGYGAKAGRSEYDQRNDRGRVEGRE